MSATQEPVAWAVVLNAIEAISMNGGATYRVTASKEEADRIAAHAMAVVPLYEHPPQPTLTDEEREAVEWFSHFGRPQNGPVIGKHAATLRGLLERLGHTGIGWKEAYDYRVEYRNVSVDSPIPPGWSWSEWIRGWRIV